MARNRKPARPDSRYSIRPEYCGHAKPRQVVRFCGAWVGQFETRADALAAAAAHHAAWMAAALRAAEG